MIPADKPAKISVSISNGMSVEIRLGAREVRIGRGREADLQLPDPSVSRLHARIFRVGEQYFLSDTSKNETYHAEKKITQLLLENGQSFGIGPYLIHFTREESFSRGTEPPTVSQTVSQTEQPQPKSISRSAPQPAKTSSITFGLTGKANVIAKLIENIRRVGSSEFPVLIEGETGSGKELVSRGIRESS